MAAKPTTALVMHPVVREELLRDDHMAALSSHTTLLAPEPYRDFQAIGAQSSQVEILLTSWGCPRVTAAELDRFPKLRLIAHLAGSVKGFVDESLWRRGVRVTNAVAANAVPVAEFTLAAILFSNKRVLTLSHYYDLYRENRAPWNREAPGAGNYGKLVGIVGASTVGRLVIDLLKPFDLDVLLYDPYVSPMAARKMGAHKVGLSELLSRADIVSLHAPLLEETRGMLGTRELALMRDGATLINTARGQLVNHAALERELLDGRLHAVLDTTDPEVLPEDSPLFELSNVLLTPHIAGSLGVEAQRLADHIVAEVHRFVTGTPLQYAVKREDLPRLA